MANDRMVRRLIDRALPLRRRNAIRIGLGLHPRCLRGRFPDLGMIGVRPGAVVIDVGANVGDFSECVLAFQPWARLHLVEPLVEPHVELRRKFGRYDDVEFSSFAFGREEGERDFFVCRYDQASSFLEASAALEGAAAGLDVSLKEVRRVRIERLEAYLREKRLERVDLLKLDVQGFELEVLEGAGDALGRIDWIYTEAQFRELYGGGPLFSDIFAFLSARGFDLKRMNSFRTDAEGRLVECDMVFRRRLPGAGGP